MACKETVNAAAVVQVRFEKHFHGFQLCARLFKLISFEIQTKNYANAVYCMCSKRHDECANSTVSSRVTSVTIIFLLNLIKFSTLRNFSAKNAHSVCDLEDACSVPLMLETPQKVGISWQAFCSSHFHNIQLDFK